MESAATENEANTACQKIRNARKTISRGDNFDKVQWDLDFKVIHLSTCKFLEVLYGVLTCKNVKNEDMKSNQTLQQ